VLPLTPGGLAVVEGSLAALLVAYGMPTGAAVAATLLYRVIGFWALVPIGWTFYAALSHRSTTGADRIPGQAASIHGPPATAPPAAAPPATASPATAPPPVADRAAPAPRAAAMVASGHAPPVADASTAAPTAGSGVGG
jgi:hypothetical protein